MELFRGDDRFLVINCSVLGQATKIAIVEDAGDNRLTNHSVSFEVNETSSQVVQLRYIECAKLLQSLQIVIRLRETGELI